MDGDEEVVEVENDEVRSALLENCTPGYHSQSATVVKVLESCFHDVCQWF